MQNLKFAELQYGQDVALSYLPQSHMAGMMLDQFICMANASLCCFADKNAITQGEGEVVLSLLKYLVEELYWRISSTSSQLASWE